MKIELQDYWTHGCECCGPDYGTYAWVDGEPVSFIGDDPRYPQTIKFGDEAHALTYILENILGHTVERKEMED